MVTTALGIPTLLHRMVALVKRIPCGAGGSWAPLVPWGWGEDPHTMDNFAAKYDLQWDN